MSEEKVKIAIEEFTSALINSVEFEKFQTAMMEYNQNHELIMLRTEFARIKKEYTTSAGDKKELSEKLEELRVKLNAHPATKNLAETQNKLSQLLRECNRAISNEIGINFANNAATSCCG